MFLTKVPCNSQYFLLDYVILDSVKQQKKEDIINKNF